MAISARPAGYSTALFRSGARSLRAGIVSGGDAASYSAGYQDVTLPAGTTDATLSFWWYPLSAEGPQAAAAAAEPDPALAQALLDGALPAGALAGDIQYALLADQNGKILQTLLWTRSNAQAWQPATYPIAKSLFGRTVRVLFGVYNDGNGRASALYVDDAALHLCAPPTTTPTATAAPATTATETALPTATATATATPTATATSMATLLPTATRTETARPSATPTATVSAAPTETLTPTTTPPNSPTPTATALACAERVNNGGFEATAAWIFPSTANPAGYSTAAVHTGARAARFGLLPGRATQLLRSSAPERNLIGELAPAGAAYSSGYQTISIPTNVTRATLTFWYNPGTADPANDFQRVMLLNPVTYAVKKTLMKVAENDRTWKQASFDLTAYRGQSIVLYFETYNNSTGSTGRTWMYLDDVSVQACTQ